MRDAFTWTSTAAALLLLCGGLLAQELGTTLVPATGPRPTLDGGGDPGPGQDDERPGFDEFGPMQDGLAHIHAQDLGPEGTNTGLPPSFLNQVVVSGLAQATAFDFTPDGRILVGEQGGRVWMIEDGELLAEPFLDLSEEVGHWSSHGLLGMAVDPLFDTNGFVYLLYVVDHHHLAHFGTPSYDPDANAPFVDTIARLTRYTADPATGRATAIPGSRRVLVGEDQASGIPVCSVAHSLGDVVFGEDGSLLVSTGDSQGGPASQTCVSQGILRPEEDVGRFRAQLVDSLSGKILRLDPSTGDGLPGNPFFDAAAPRAARSRVWSLGLRMPFRLTVRPGSGEADPGLADPGTLYVAEVGESHREELEVVPQGGTNMGWPVFEGLGHHPVYASMAVPNQDAPNPLYGSGFPGEGADQPYLTFQQLVVQDHLQTPGSTHQVQFAPDVGQATLFTHHRPTLAWDHQQGAWVPTYDAQGRAKATALGTPGSPVQGEAFAGNGSVAGAWVTGDGFPPPYTNSYYHADFGLGWIRRMTFDPHDRLVSVKAFGVGMGRIVDMKPHPVSGNLFYVDYDDFGNSAVHRIRYVPGDQPPLAKAVAEPAWGHAPLDVTLDGGASSDPEGLAVQYAWTFADGTPPSRLARPVRTMPARDVSAEGAVIAKVLEMDPPGSMGPGNPDIDVIRDGVYPPEGTTNPLLGYDTGHFGPNLLPDKGEDDWFGYVFDSPRQFVGVVFHEGLGLDLGGYFEDGFDVEVLQGDTWTLVESATVEPPYLGSGSPSFEAYEVRFPAVAGSGIRLRGVPGGPLKYLTVSELRVLALLDPMPTTPHNLRATLTVTDAVGATHSTEVTVSVNNTPPHVGIVSPADLITYSTDSPTLMPLQATGWDAEQPNSELTCGWQVVLHHDNHTHPGPVDARCLNQAILTTDGHGCEEQHFQEVRFTVRDPLGLATTDSHYLIPDCDLNLNGAPDVDDLLHGTSLDLDEDGIPDEAQVDCNGDGTPDLYQIAFGQLPDENGNGVPDDCDGLFRPPLHPAGALPLGSSPILGDGD